MARVSVCMELVRLLRAHYILMYEYICGSATSSTNSNCYPILVLCYEEEES